MKSILKAFGIAWLAATLLALLAMEVHAKKLTDEERGQRDKILVECESRKPSPTPASRRVAKMSHKDRTKAYREHRKKLVDAIGADPGNLHIVVNGECLTFAPLEADDE
jgi:hypothetical protein